MIRMLACHGKRIRGAEVADEAEGRCKENEHGKRRLANVECEDCRRGPPDRSICETDSSGEEASD